MKAIVHIGMPKCGSTSIQRWLDINAAALSSRGVGYDRLSLPGHYPSTAHEGIKICHSHRLGRLVESAFVRRVHGITDLSDQERFVRTFEDFFGAHVRSRREPVFIVSSEYIAAHTHTPAEVEALESWLAQFFDATRYILYVRRQEDWLASAYSQDLKRGVTETLPQVVAQSAVQDWHAKAALWADTLGEDRVEIGLTERDALRDGDLVADFAARIGTDLEGLADAPRLNESLSAAGAALLRVANERMDHLSSDGTKVDPRKLAVRQALERQTLDLPKVRLNAEQVRHVREVNAASNERLRARFFPDRDVLFPARPDPQTDEPALRAEDVARAGLDLLLTLRAQGKGGGGRTAPKGARKGRAARRQRPSGGNESGDAPPAAPPQ